MTDRISKNLFWDSCVFIRWLTETPNEYVDDIHQFLKEATRGELKIYISTMSFAGSVSV